MVTAYEYFRFILGGIKVANIVIFYQNSAAAKKHDNMNCLHEGYITDML